MTSTLLLRATRYPLAFAGPLPCSSSTMKPFSVLTFIAGLTVVAHGNSDSVGKQAKQRALYAPYPEYPLAARQRHWTGAGVFICHLRADETVASVNVCRSTGHQMLDQAAAAARRRWRFQPRGREGGQGTSIFLHEPQSRAASDGGRCDPRLSGQQQASICQGICFLCQTQSHAMSMANRRS